MSEFKEADKKMTVEEALALVEENLISTRAGEVAGWTYNFLYDQAKEVSAKAGDKRAQIIAAYFITGIRGEETFMAGNDTHAEPAANAANLAMAKKWEEAGQVFYHELSP